MADTRHTRLLIIGSGPAGYTAGIYGARALLEPLIIEGIEPGGQLTTTTDVENWPGMITQGPDLMSAMKDHAQKMGAETVSDVIAEIDLSKRPFVATGESGTIYTADAVILATGAKAKWLGLESEQAYRGFGVSACATCDGFFYRGKEIAVVGGGNTAVEEALFLTNFGSKVYVIHRRNELRCEAILEERLLNNPKVEMIWDHVIDEVLGEDSPKGVTGVRLKHATTGVERVLDVHGLFIAIGHEPASELVKGQLELKGNGTVVTKPDSTQTSIPGVFAAGDLIDDIFRQAITSAGHGCMAALEAEKFLADHEDTTPNAEALLGETAGM